MQTGRGFLGTVDVDPQRRLGLLKRGGALDHRVVEFRAPLIDTLPQEESRTEGLREAADQVRRVGSCGCPRLVVALSESALPEHDPVLDDRGRETWDVGLDSERVEVSFENRKGESLSFSLLYEDNSTEQHGSGNAESLQAGQG